MLSTVIVGYGRAGRDLHVPSLLRLGSRPIWVVEPGAAGLSPGAGIAGALPSLQIAAEHVAPEAAVVHVCTPPDTHADVVAECVQLGYRRIIIEKPMVTTATDLARILALEATGDLQVLVVANWLSSSLASHVKRLILDCHGGIEYMRLHQSKPRIQRALKRREGVSIFDIEVPHQIALALYLGGPASLVDVEWAPLELGDSNYIECGHTSLVLRHENGALAVIENDLGAPMRERRLEVGLGRAVLHGYFPCDSQDFYSHLYSFDRRGEVFSRQLYFDDTLSQFMADAYGYFERGGVKPISTPAFHARVCELLFEAKARGRRARQSDIRELGSMAAVERAASEAS